MNINNKNNTNLKSSMIPLTKTHLLNVSTILMNALNNKIDRNKFKIDVFPNQKKMFDPKGYDKKYMKKINKNRNNWLLTQAARRLKLSMEDSFEIEVSFRQPFTFLNFTGIDDYELKIIYQYLKDTYKFDYLTKLNLWDIDDNEFIANSSFFMILAENKNISWDDFFARIHIIDFEDCNEDEIVKYFFKNFGRKTKLAKSINLKNEDEISLYNEDIVGEDILKSILNNYHLQNIQIETFSRENKAIKSKVIEKDIEIQKLKKQIENLKKEKLRTKEKEKKENQSLIEENGKLKEDKNNKQRIIANQTKQIDKLSFKDSKIESTVNNFNFYLKNDKLNEDTNIDLTMYKKVILVSFINRQNLPSNFEQFNEINKLSQLKNKITNYDLVIIDTKNITHSATNLIKSTGISTLFLTNEMIDNKKTA